MKTLNTKTLHRKRRHKRIRAKISGTSMRPRLSIFKSNKYISAQLIDDEKMATLAQVNSKTGKEKTELLRAGKVGEKIAETAGKLGITEASFDRGGFIYTGKVKAVAEGARKGGLKL